MRSRATCTAAWMTIGCDDGVAPLRQAFSEEADPAAGLERLRVARTPERGDSQVVLAAFVEPGGVFPRIVAERPHALEVVGGGLLARLPRRRLALGTHDAETMDSNGHASRSQVGRRQDRTVGGLGTETFDLRHERTYRMLLGRCEGAERQHVRSPKSRRRWPRSRSSRARRRPAQPRPVRRATDGVVIGMTIGRPRHDQCRLCVTEVSQTCAEVRLVRRDQRGRESRGGAPSVHRAPVAPALRCARPREWTRSHSRSTVRLHPWDASPSVTATISNGTPESASQRIAPAQPRTSSSGWGATMTARAQHRRWCIRPLQPIGDARHHGAAHHVTMSSA